MATADDTKKQVQKLAELARIEVSEAELSKFASEIEAILGYVSALETLEITNTANSANTAKNAQHLPYTNVFREDGEPHEKGKYTEKLAEQFPAREGDLLSVKQILSHDE